MLLQYFVRLSLNEIYKKNKDAVDINRSGKNEPVNKQIGTRQTTYVRNLFRVKLILIKINERSQYYISFS